MAVKVVDASALAAILFAEPEADQVADRLEDAALAAPALLDYEITSVCLGKLRRHPERRDAILAGYAHFRDLDIAPVDVELQEVLALAEKSALTVYDACYLWLAGSLGAELVTLDRPLLAVWRRRARGQRRD
jgi:predicted nucleic acid-binding protein